MKKTVYIFGAGQAGEAAAKQLTDVNIAGFLDNNQAKAGSDIDGLPVLHTSELAELSFDFIYIASEFFEKIEQQLINDFAIDAARIKVLSACQIKGFHFEHNDCSVAEDVLGLLCEQLEQRDISFYVDAGTLLGVYRDNALIPWDDDLDLALLSSDMAQVMAELEDILHALRQLTGAAWQANSYTSTYDFGAVKQGDIRSVKLSPVNANTGLPSVDLFVKYIDDERMDFVLASRGITTHSRFMHYRRSYRFRSHRLIVPEDTEGYLAGHYGESWRTPIKQWNLSMLEGGTPL